MNIQRVLFITAMLVLTTACGTVIEKYNPNPVAFKLSNEQIPKISISSAVNIINDQPSEEDVLLREVGRIDWMGNLHAWTDAAINQAVRRLGPTKVSVTDDAQKTLKFSITKAELIYGSVMTRSIVNLRVITGDGIELNFSGDHRATAGIWHLPKVAMDGAVSNAAILAINDSNVLAYLSQ